MSHFVGRVRRMDRSSRRLAASRPSVEAIEPRALMSVAHGAAAAVVSIRNDHAPPHFFRDHGLLPPPKPKAPPHHPLNQKVFGGSVKKQAMFYSGYRGPQSPSLDAVRASAQVIPNAIAFTGRVRGPIDPTQPAHYVFLLNRGGSVGFGPYAKRANMVFDALVDVQTGPSGPSARVILYPTQPVKMNTVEVPPSVSNYTSLPADAPIPLYGPTLNPTSTTALPASNVKVSGNTVSVVVPLSDVPPTSKNPDLLFLTRYLYGFSVQRELNNPAQIASFAPEYNLIPLSIPKK